MGLIRKHNATSDENSNGGNGNGDMTCWNFAQNPEDGDAYINGDVFPDLVS